MWKDPSQSEEHEKVIKCLAGEVKVGVGLDSRTEEGRIEAAIVLAQRHVFPGLDSRLKTDVVRLLGAAACRTDSVVYALKSAEALRGIVDLFKDDAAQMGIISNHIASMAGPELPGQKSESMLFLLDLLLPHAQRTIRHRIFDENLIDNENEAIRFQAAIAITYAGYEITDEMRQKIIDILFGREGLGGADPGNAIRAATALMFYWDHLDPEENAILCNALKTMSLDQESRLTLIEPMSFIAPALNFELTQFFTALLTGGEGMLSDGLDYQRRTQEALGRAWHYLYPGQRTQIKEYLRGAATAMGVSHESDRVRACKAVVKTTERSILTKEISKVGQGLPIRHVSRDDYFATVEAFTSPTGEIKRVQEARSLWPPRDINHFNSDPRRGLALASMFKRALEDFKERGEGYQYGGLSLHDIAVRLTGWFNEGIRSETVEDARVVPYVLNISEELIYVAANHSDWETRKQALSTILRGLCHLSRDLVTCRKQIDARPRNARLLAQEIWLQKQIDRVVSRLYDALGNNADIERLLNDSFVILKKERVFDLGSISETAKQIWDRAPDAAESRFLLYGVASSVWRDRSESPKVARAKSKADPGARLDDKRFSLMYPLHIPGVVEIEERNVGQGDAWDEERFKKEREKIEPNATTVVMLADVVGRDGRVIESGKVVGYAHCNVHKRHGYEHRMEIMRFGIHPDYDGLDLEEDLLKEVQRQCRLRACKELVAFVDVGKMGSPWDMLLDKARFRSAEEVNPGEPHYSGSVRAIPMIWSVRQMKLPEGFEPPTEEDARLGAGPYAALPIPLGTGYEAHDILDAAIESSHNGDNFNVVDLRNQDQAYEEIIGHVYRCLERNNLSYLTKVFSDLLSSTRDKEAIMANPDNVTDETLIPRVNLLETNGEPICYVDVADLDESYYNELLDLGYLSVYDKKIKIWGHASDRGIHVIDTGDPEHTACLIIFELLRFMGLEQELAEKVYIALFGEDGVNAELDGNLQRDIEIHITSGLVGEVWPAQALKRPFNLLANAEDNDVQRQIAIATVDSVNLGKMNLARKQFGKEIMQEGNEIVIPEEYLEDFAELISHKKPQDIVIVKTVEEAIGMAKEANKNRIVLLKKEHLRGIPEGDLQCRVMELENYNFLHLAASIELGRSILVGVPGAVNEFYGLLMGAPAPKDWAQRYIDLQKGKIRLPLPDIKTITGELNKMRREFARFITSA